MNEKINLINIVPKGWNIEYLGNYFKVSYETKGRGNSPKSFVLPKEITIDKNFIEAIALYIGDGKLSKDLNHIEFTSIDKDLLYFMLDFFKNRFNLNIRKFTYRDYAFQINGKIFRVLFGKLIDLVYDSNLQNKIELRKAFLRGLFAAEGCIGIVKKENYIAYVAFHLSYNKEEKLADFVQKLLNLENITCKQIIRKNKGERCIQITSWSNYYKCWKIKLFDLCGRKKKRFLDKIEKTNFFFKVKYEFIHKLLDSSDLPHRKIALELGIASETLCVLNKEKTQYVNKKYLLKLAEFNKIPTREIRKNILCARVNMSTNINDKEFIDFILKGN